MPLINGIVSRLANGATAIAPADYGSQWLKEHNRHIGSSDAAAACGRSQYSQPRDVYNQKVCGISKFATKQMRRGRRYERPIAEEYSERYDVPLLYPLSMYQHPEIEYVCATPDAAVITGGAANVGVEIKLCDWWRARKLGEEETDEVFDDWLIQAQHQMWTCGFDVIEIFVCLDHSTHRLFRVERNDELIKVIASAERFVWKAIEAGRPPEVDYFHETALEIATLLPLREDPLPVTFDDNPALPDLCARYNRLSAAMSRLKKTHRAVKAQIIDACMGERHVVIPDQFRVKQTDVADTVVPEHVRKGYRHLTVTPLKK